MIYYKQVFLAIILCIVELVCQIVVVNVIIYCGQIIHLDEQMDENRTYYVQLAYILPTYLS